MYSCGSLLIVAMFEDGGMKLGFSPRTMDRAEAAL
jgi:hypothetical protein